MRRYRSAIPVLFLFVAGLAYADSITTFTITKAIIDVFPHSGGFDNAGFLFTGPGGFSFSGIGDTVCCQDYETFSAGDPIGGFGIVSWPGNFTLTIGKTTYDPDTVDLSLIDINFLGALTVPGGEVPAMLSNLFTGGLIQGSAVSSGGEFVAFNLKIPPGRFSINFAPVEGDPSLFQFSDAEFRAVSTVPEPGTLGLMATGLAGIVGLVRRKHRSGRAVNS